MDNKGHLLNQLQKKSGIDDRDKVERVTRAVLSQLHDRLGPEADHLEAQLPEDVKPLYRPGPVQRVVNAVTADSKFHFDEMVQNVATEAQVDSEKAREMTHEIFHQLKEQISEGEVRHVAAVLPSDIQQEWERA